MSVEDDINYVIGDKVVIQTTSGDQDGRVRWKGNTKFADGLWLGVELDGPFGKHNGTIQGVSYFTCKPNHGAFAQKSKILGFSEKTRGYEKYSRFASQMCHLFPVVDEQIQHGLNLVKRTAAYIEMVVKFYQESANNIFKINSDKLPISKNKKKDLHTTREKSTQMNGLGKHTRIISSVQDMVLNTAKIQRQCAQKIIDQVVNALLHFYSNGDKKRKQYVKQYKQQLEQIKTRNVSIEKDRHECLRLYKQMKDAESEYTQALMQLTNLGHEDEDNDNKVQKLRNKISQRHEKLDKKKIQVEHYFSEYKTNIEKSNIFIQTIHNKHIPGILAAMEELEAERLDELSRRLTLFASLHSSMLSPILNGSDTIINTIQSVSRSAQMQLWVEKQLKMHDSAEIYQKLVYDLPSEVHTKVQPVASENNTTTTTTTTTTTRISVPDNSENIIQVNDEKELHLPKTARWKSVSLSRTRLYLKNPLNKSPKSTIEESPKVSDSQTVFQTLNTGVWVECVKATCSYSSDDPTMLNYNAGDIIMVEDHSMIDKEGNSVIDKKGNELWKGKRILASGCQEEPGKLFQPANIEKLPITEEISLIHLLQIPIGVHHFSFHLCREYSQENISFWIEVRDWQKLMIQEYSSENHDAMLKKAKDIYEKYIKPGGSDQVNIPGPVQTEVGRQLDKYQSTSGNLDPDLFGPAHLEIFLLLKGDSFKRFCKSDHFKMFIQEANNNEIDTDSFKNKNIKE